MPATTPNRNYPYPLDPDPIDVAGDIEALARAVDLDVENVNVGTIQHTPAYFAILGAGGSSGGGLDIAGGSFPAQAVAGIVIAWVHLRLDFTGGTDYTVVLQLAGITVAQRRFDVIDLSTQFGSPRITTTHLHAASAINAGVGLAVNVRGTGIAQVTAYADPSVNRVDCLYIPNRATP